MFLFLDRSPNNVIHHNYIIESSKTDTIYQYRANASWYGPGFHGRKTASGEIYNQNKLTAASVILPLGSIVKITNLNNQKSIKVRINDRGPYSYKVVDKSVIPTYPLKPHPSRVIDLSRAAMDSLGGISSGIIPISYTTDIY
jgi:rare lipoprotein A